MVPAPRIANATLASIISREGANLYPIAIADQIDDIQQSLINLAVQKTHDLQTRQIWPLPEHATGVRVRTTAQSRG